MKRKIEDYKDQKVAIHCSTKEEWDKIVDLLPSGRSVERIHWQGKVNYGKSDTIDIDGCGWSPKKHYEDESCTIYPASDFLEKESVNSLLENEIYYNLPSNNIVRWKNPTGGNYLGNGCTIYKSDYGGNFHNNVKQYRLVTPEEKHWFLECEKANRFIPYDEAMKTFSKQKPFKFNIGDEIKAKPGGYYISSPQHFAESHKKQYPSNETTISGKITERTQAQGFNWYRCSYGNWITEEGVELIKEDIPEYVEYIDTKYKGQIVKVEEWTNHSFCCIRFENGQREQPFKNLVKPSTKEAFDLQNQSKNMNEDIFCIELNSQEELDAIMNFYKQKGFKELGDSHEYYNGYVVFIKMKDKKWQTSVCNDLNYPVKTLSELGIEVKSKSLVGRYLKALVDYPNAGSVLKGEIGIITKEYNGIPLQVDFPSQKYYSINDIVYKKGKSYELMPEGFKLEDDLISEAKKRYPIGTKFRPANIPNNITEYCIVTEDSIFHKYRDEIELTINGEYSIYGENSKYGNTDYSRIVYYQGKWAEIVSDEPEINTYGLKVGDTLKQEIINAWAYIEGNFCEYVQEGWVDTFCRYGGDRKIEDFRDIEGQIGFHVSGCTEGTHYLKAEGFKEFADNFYKKEKEGMLEMLPYPKDNYFKAVVVKDIHKKDIETKGDMPDLIPKGYQTWFISEIWRERILSKKDVVCPESNRWRANIPPEYFEIVEEKESGMLVFGKYKVGDVVVSLEQKAPYRVVGDMFEVLESNIDALYYLHDTCSLASKEWRAATEEEIKAFQQGIKNVNDIPKIGDYVVITKGTDNWSSKMNHYIGKVAKLTSCLSDDKNTFRIDLDNGDWEWQLKHNHFRKAKPDEIPLKQITMSIQEIQQICKEKYPIGCKYKCVNINSEHILLQDNYTYTIVNNEIWASYGKGCLYSNGKYAELISLPKSDWNPQIGDHVIIISPKEENNWAPGMDKYVGKLAKITKKREDTSFEIDLDNAYYVWDYKPHRKFFRKAEPHEISTKSVTKKKREITLVPLIQPKTVKVFDREENFF